MKKNVEKDGQMEIDCEGQKAKGITKRNENRLRKHELPFMDSAGKGNKLKKYSELFFELKNKFVE